MRAHTWTAVSHARSRDAHSSVLVYRAPARNCIGGTGGFVGSRLLQSHHLHHQVTISGIGLGHSLSATIKL